MVIDIADHAALTLTELADCEACGVRPETGERVWAIDACERHSALLARESDPGRLVADGGHVLIRPANTRSDRIYHQPDADDPERPACVQGRSGNEARRYQRRDPDRLEDDYRLCSYCDPEWEVTRDGDDMDAYHALDAADDLDDLRADGGTVEVDAEVYRETLDELQGIADDLHGSGIEVSANAIAERADRLAAAEVERDD